VLKVTHRFLLEQPSCHALLIRNSSILLFYSKQWTVQDHRFPTIPDKNVRPWRPTPAPDTLLSIMTRHQRIRASAWILAVFLVAACDGGGSWKDGGEAGAGGDGGSAVGDGAGPTDGTGSQGGAPVGSPCEVDTDCNQALELICFTEVGGVMGAPKITFPNGYCSKGCLGGDEEVDCGENAGCATMGFGGGQTSAQLQFCARICDNVADCREAEGYKCMKLLPFFPGSCSPG
jgi:hypothetical protein